MKLWFITWLLCFCNTHSDMEDNLSLKNSTNTPIDHKRKLEADYTPHDLVQHEKLPYIVYKWSSYSYSYLPEWVCDCWCFVFQSWILPLHYGICRCCGVYALCCDSPCVIYESRLEHLRRCLYVLRVIIFNNKKKQQKKKQKKKLLFILVLNHHSGIHTFWSRGAGLCTVLKCYQWTPLLLILYQSIGSRPTHTKLSYLLPYPVASSMSSLFYLISVSNFLFCMFLGLPVSPLSFLGSSEKTL